MRRHGQHATIIQQPGPARRPLTEARARPAGQPARHPPPWNRSRRRPAHGQHTCRRTPRPVTTRSHHAAQFRGNPAPSRPRDCDDEPAAKPSPEGVCRLLSDLRVSSSAAVLVGDSPADLLSGRSAGVRTVACSWGIGKPEALARYDPWRTVTTIEELAKLLRRLIGGPSRPPCEAHRKRTGDF